MNEALYAQVYAERYYPAAVHPALDGSVMADQEVLVRANEAAEVERRRRHLTLP